LGSPNQAARRAMQVARDRTSDALEQINQFFTTDFKEYQDKVQATSFPLFKDYEPVRMN